jgi:hypothetical protein
MLKIFVTLALTKLAIALHPVSTDIVYAIKSRTNAWQPLEIEENPFKDYSLEEIQGLCGLVINHD